MKEPLNFRDSQLKKLLEVIVKIESVEECKKFMLDLCTPSELKSLTDRWEVARLITQGLNYRDIAEKTKTSTATITRVGQALKYGKGGYNFALDKEKRK